MPVDWEDFLTEEDAPPADEPGPIGGYVNPYSKQRGAEGRYGGNGRYDAPVYYDDDEFTIVGGWSAERQMGLQYAMIDAGFLSAATLDNGYDPKHPWNAASKNAFRKVLTLANTQGRSWQQVLNGALDGAQQRDSSGPGSGSRGAGRAPLQIRLSNPDDLKKVFRNAAQGVTGGVFVDPKQIDEMVSAYQGKEAEFQRQAYAGQSTLTDAPTAEGFAVDQLETLDENGAEANKFAQMTQVLLELTGGS